MSDFVYLRGTGGGVFEYTPPLHREIRKQYDARQLVQVNADGSAYEGSPWVPDDPEADTEDDEAEDDGTADGEAPAPKRGRTPKAPADGA